MDFIQDWQPCNSETFWREVAPCSHVVQIYENDEALLNLLEDFVAGGISGNDAIIVIATKAHLTELAQRLAEHGLNVNALSKTNQYLPFDAEEVLSKFMVNDWPDYGLFLDTITPIFDRVRNSGRQVRAFGEMVALLWSQGNSGATLMLEHLWNAFFEKESFSLFCAYPKNKFPEDATNTLSYICKAHSKLITNSDKSRFDLAYIDIST